MNSMILQELRKITPEEQAILEGPSRVNQALYHSEGADGNVYEAQRLIAAGKQIDIRKHTRFVSFPPHTHDYVEVLYMCTGSTHHKIGGQEVLVQAGELLFLNQHAVQEIEAAGEDDIGINFLILPSFFDQSLLLMGNAQSPLRDFIIGCLTDADPASHYLHFKVSDVLPIQNLVENLIWTLMNREPNRRSIQQMTMGLLFLELINHASSAEIHTSPDRRWTLSVLDYIESHYADAELSALAEDLHYDVSWLSREIRRTTGKTFTELVQTKRLSQASYLLENTRMPVSEIANAVGYENISYFHRLFSREFHMTPNAFRKKDAGKV
ncbi:MAG: helix-turn-helix domain-containing protein [Lachnospiraceae bacterium]|nr:helix-turn-helix domain-containing protein [Lachnospiraceae bacterium]